MSYRLAALQSERALLPQLVVQVVAGEAEGGGGVVKHHMQSGAHLGDVERLWSPDCLKNHTRII